eukprot:19453-Heterococcus_DN1.PRE.2
MQRAVAAAKPPVPVQLPSGRQPVHPRSERSTPATAVLDTGSSQYEAIKRQRQQQQQVQAAEAVRLRQRPTGQRRRAPEQAEMVRAEIKREGLELRCVALERAAAVLRHQTAAEQRERSRVINELQVRAALLRTSSKYLYKQLSSSFNRLTSPICIDRALKSLQAICAEKAAVVQHKAARNAALADILTALKQRRLYAEFLEGSSSGSCAQQKSSSSDSGSSAQHKGKGRGKQKQKQQQQQQQKQHEVTRQVTGGESHASSDVADDVAKGEQSELTKRFWALQERAAAAATPVQRGGTAGSVVGFADSADAAVLRGAETEDLVTDILDEPKLMSIKLK